MQQTVGICYFCPILSSVDDDQTDVCISLFCRDFLIPDEYIPLYRNISVVIRMRGVIPVGFHVQYLLYHI